MHRVVTNILLALRKNWANIWVGRLDVASTNKKVAIKDCFARLSKCFSQGTIVVKYRHSEGLHVITEDITKKNVPQLQ